MRAIHVFTEKNPQPDVATFRLGPRAGRARVATRIRLADSQAVVAIGELSDGSFWSAQRRRRGHARRVPRGRDLAVASALINVPAARQARRDHRDQDADLAPMETGYRRTQLGALIPRDIIRRFVCTYNGTEVFRAELHPAIAANPFIVFSTVATESGTLEFHVDRRQRLHGDGVGRHRVSSEEPRRGCRGGVRSPLAACAVRRSPPRSRRPSAAPATTS